MSDRLSLAILCVLLALAACADDKQVDPGTAMFVDVERVTAETDLAPVNGLRAAGQPDAEVLQRFAEAGYAAVIDLRAVDEDRGMDEKAVVEDLGLDYILLPIDDAEDVSFDTARQLDELLSGYEGPVLVHCASSNRVGALLALRESLAGASDDEALEVGRQSGLTRLEPLVRERLESR